MVCNVVSPNTAEEVSMSKKNTKQALANALKECMRHQPLSQISIQDIVAQCCLNRNSFYYHFKDKYELVTWIFDTESAPFFVQETQDIWEEFYKTFQFFYDNKAFYTCAIQDEGQNSFANHFYEVLKGTFMDSVAELFPNSEDQEFFATFFLDALLACIKRWLMGGAAQTPEELTHLLKTILTGMTSIVSGEFKPR